MRGISRRDYRARTPPQGAGRRPGDLEVSPDGTRRCFVAATDPVEAISTNADVHPCWAAGHRPGERLPAVVLVHGGPRSRGAADADLMALLDAAIASGDVDGGLRGGRELRRLHGELHRRPDRFCCLVVHAGPYDLTASWATTEEPWSPERDLGGGPPWERPEERARFSPDRFVARPKTPTLVARGELR